MPKTATRADDVGVADQVITKLTNAIAKLEAFIPAAIEQLFDAGASAETREAVARAGDELAAIRERIANAGSQ